jgi:Bacterial Ig domain
MTSLPSGDLEVAGGVTVSDPAVVVPADGVITRWRVKAGPDVTPVRLRVLRPGPLREVGRSSLQESEPDAVTVLEARLAVLAGDRIALDCCATRGRFFTSPGPSDLWTPPLADGAIAPAPTDVALIPILNADIEPDADGDGFGDESQDNCPGVAGPVAGCAAAPPPPAPRVNAPPTVRFVTPVAATTVGAAQRIDLEVSDDAGSPRVTVHDDDGTICTLTAAPYSCIWTPTGADVGRATLLASATDSDGRTTLGIVRVTVPRFAATLTRRRSGRRVTGRLRLPAAVEPALGCRGTVTVRRGKAKRTAALKPNCTYAVRLPRKASGAVKARFGGNPVVLPT